MTMQPISEITTTESAPLPAQVRQATSRGHSFVAFLQQVQSGTTTASPSRQVLPTAPGAITSRLALQTTPTPPRFLFRGSKVEMWAMMAAPAPPESKRAMSPSPSHHAQLAGITPVPSVQPPGITGPMTLADYPRPPADNGRGIHWIPSVRSDREVVDRFVAEAQDMHMRWVTLLNDGTQIGDNDYLVQRLTDAGIMPVMRVYTDSGAPIGGNLKALVQHYQEMGVSYFQLYNEPNLRVENQGRDPDPVRYADLWAKAAQEVIEAGGLPGFASLSPQGDVDDLEFLRTALREIKDRGQTHLLDRAWISAHNYGQDYLRVRLYDQILQEEIGRSLPLIGTEAGFYAEDEGEQVRTVTQAYDYMRSSEPHYFAYSYWVIANEMGGNPDQRWNHQALFRPNGTSPIVNWLQKNEA